FFFSSRRRHTRFSRDWSSDVCSSDLKAGFGSTITDIEIRDGYDHADLREKVGKLAFAAFEESLELVQMANDPLDHEEFLAGRQTPVLFGTALGNFAVDHVLNTFIQWAPPPKAHPTHERVVEATEEGFSGFVFKIQANMDPKHRDRIAFMRICSGR